MKSKSVVLFPVADLIWHLKLELFFAFKDLFIFMENVDLQREVETKRNIPSDGSLPKWSQPEMSLSDARSFFWIFQRGAVAQGLGPVSTIFPGLKQGEGSDMMQQGHWHQRVKD